MDSRLRNFLWTLVAACGFAAMGTGTAGPLRFVYPVNEQMVAGDNVLVWVAEDVDPASTPSAEEVVLEFSLDGSRFEPLVRHDAPDLGIGSVTTGLDTTAFPVGPLFVRARHASESTGPTLRLFVNRLPMARCTSRSAGQGGRFVQFDCSQSSDPDGSIQRFEWTFGDGATLVTATPTVTHLYPNFGEFFPEIKLTDDLGFSSTLLKQLLFRLEADRLRVVGPTPNRVPRGTAARIAAQVQFGSAGVPLAEVVFTKQVGVLRFTSGRVSDDGATSRVITDASGRASVNVVTDAGGPALVRVTVSGTLLSAFSYFLGL
jgi:hypothetical protein